MSYPIHSILVIMQVPKFLYQESMTWPHGPESWSKCRSESLIRAWACALQGEARSQILACNWSIRTILFSDWLSLTQVWQELLGTLAQLPQPAEFLSREVVFTQLRFPTREMLSLSKCWKFQHLIQSSLLFPATKALKICSWIHSIENFCLNSWYRS